MDNLHLTRVPMMQTGMLIRRPVADVFEAFVNSDITTQFWFTKSSGRLEPGAHVEWAWEMYDVSAAATILFALLFLFALGNAYRYVLRREIRQHREWMIRAFAIGLAVATIRPIIGMFFASSRLSGLRPNAFFGIAFWIGFVLTGFYEDRRSEADGNPIRQYMPSYYVARAQKLA